MDRNGFRASVYSTSSSRPGTHCSGFSLVASGLPFRLTNPHAYLVLSFSFFFKRINFIFRGAHNSSAESKVKISNSTLYRCPIAISPARLVLC